MDIEATSQCSKSDERKPADEFSSDRRQAHWCRSCMNEYHRARRRANPERSRAAQSRWIKANRAKRAMYARRWRAKFPDKYRRYRLRNELLRRYGLTLARYDEMLKACGNACQICAAPGVEGVRGRLYVDHCHITGAVRGLLCAQCNIGIGALSDSLERVERAAAYLRQYNTSGCPSHHTREGNQKERVT